MGSVFHAPEIKHTFNRHAKSQGGIIGCSRNHSAYYRWCMTRHCRAIYLQATMEMAAMDSSSGALVTNDIEEDLMSVRQVGEDA